jgi:hypothetical protein
VVLEGALDRGAVGIRIELEPVDDVDTLDDEDAVLVLDLAPRFGDESAFACGDVTRLQRASERPSQSTGGSGDDVVHGGRMLGLAPARDPIVVGDFVVHTEPDGFRCAGQLCPAPRSHQSLPTCAAGVDDLAQFRSSPAPATSPRSC